MATERAVIAVKPAGIVLIGVGAATNRRSATAACSHELMTPEA
jgi:hypothetical protein